MMLPTPVDERLAAGAAELMRIVLANDKNDAFAHHMVFRVAVELALALPDASRRGAPDLIALIHAERRPAHFLEFVASALRSIRDRQDEAFASGSLRTMPVVSEFDLHAMQALAQALADVVWAERRADSFSGPSFETCRARLAAAKDTELLTPLLQNYVGNILQLHFVEARIRYTVKDLPRDAELWLRTEYARTIAERAVARLRSETPAARGVGEALRYVISSTVEHGA